MFNDKYGLTQAVLDGRKTQTRRFPSQKIIEKYKDLLEDYETHSRSVGVPCSIVGIEEFLSKRSPYKVGEVVAVAQRYSNVYAELLLDWEKHNYHLPREMSAEKFRNRFEKEKGWSNKMFVKSELMPHQVKITNVRVQKLQEITYHDCLREGVYIFDEDPMNPLAYIYTYPGANQLFYHPIDAYAQLIDAISGKGTWESNPYVYTYDFELVR